MAKKGRKLGNRSIEIMKFALKQGGISLAQMTWIPPEYRSGAGRVYYVKSAHNLKRSGYFKPGKQNESFLHFTPQGRYEILKHLHLEKIFKTKWDGHFRLVIFDVPETKKQIREYAREKLKELGFVQLQISVYITPYPVTEELDRILTEVGARKYFQFLTVSEMDGEDTLKKRFGLSKK